MGPGLAYSSLSPSIHPWKNCFPGQHVWYTQPCEISKVAAKLISKATSVTLIEGMTFPYTFLLNICPFNLKFLLLLWQVMEWAPDGNAFL